MADIRAILSNSNFSLPATWFGGVVPGSGDVAFANGNTVLVSGTHTVQAVSNASGTGITVGGTFSLLGGCNLTCTNANGVIQGATTTSCITTAGLGAGSSASVVSNLSHTSATPSSSLVAFPSSGTLNVVGSIVGGAVSNGIGISVSGSGTLNHTGAVTGGTSSNASGVAVLGGATLNFTGTITGGTNSNGAQGINISSAGANVLVTGNVLGGAGGAAAAGIVNNAASTLTVNGTCQSSASAPAIAGGVATQITRLSGPFLIGASGNVNPVPVFSWRWAPTQIPTYYEVVAANGTTKRSLFTSDNIPTANYPTTGSVRSGVIYGPSNENTGTLAVPAAASVALGVAVDNTTGTAILTASSVRTAIGLASANLDTQIAAIPNASQNASAVRTDLTPELSRIQNCSTVDTTAQTVQNAVSS